MTTAHPHHPLRNQPSDSVLLPPIAANRPSVVSNPTPTPSAKEPTSGQGASNPKLSGGSRRGSYSNSGNGAGSTPLGSARQSHHSVVPPVQRTPVPAYSLGQSGPSIDMGSRLSTSNFASRSRQNSANPNHALALGASGAGGGGGLRPLAPLVTATSHDSHLNPATMTIPGSNGGSGSSVVGSQTQAAVHSAAAASSMGAFMTAPAVVMASAEKLSVPRQPSSRLRTPSPVLRPVSHDSLGHADRPTMMASSSHQSSSPPASIDRPSRPPSSTGSTAGRGYLKASPLQAIMSPIDTPTKGASVNASRSVVQTPPQNGAANAESETAAAAKENDSSNDNGNIEDATHVVLTRDVVVAKNVPKMDQVAQSQSDLDQQLKSISHVRLDRLHLVDVSFLTALPHITNLYLQHNNLSTAAGLSSLRNLRFLTLAHNRLTTIGDLSNLPRLILLDLSSNRLPAPLPTHIPHLPKSLVFLDMSNNPCTSSLSTPDLIDLIAPHLPALEELNGQAVLHSLPVHGEDDGHQDRPDDDEDFLAYLTYAGTADHLGASSLIAGSVSTLIDSARGGADPLALAVASHVTQSAAGEPGVLKVAAFNVAEVREAVVGTLRRAGGAGRRSEASREYSARVKEVKQRFGFGGDGNGRVSGVVPQVAAASGQGKGEVAEEISVVVEDDESGVGSAGKITQQGASGGTPKSQSSMERIGTRVGPP